MEIHFAQVVWFNPAKGFGVAGLRKNGATTGIHRDRGRVFYRGTDSPELRLSGRHLNTDPKEGDDICLIPGGRSRKGDPCAKVWAMADDWEAANHDIAERYRKLRLYEQNKDFLQAEAVRLRERDRLRCNPLFRLIEQEYRFAQPTSKPALIRFQGTQAELRYRQTPTVLNREPKLLTESGKVIDGYQYVRWFEREIINGWRKCDNPLTIELPPLPPSRWGFEESCFALKQAKIYRAPWRMTGVGFLWRLDGKTLAQGNCEKVLVKQADLHEETSFTGGEAEYLWEMCDRTDIGVIPHANHYSM